MPRKNTVKFYDVDSYYHVYNRGVNKRKIFLDDQDYVYFMSLLKRYLAQEFVRDASGRPYPNLYGQVELAAFCLMPNHFHMLVYQKEDARAVEKLLRSLSTGYTMYFNRKYKRVGHLFEGTYKASRIMDEPYLLHISRYIHMNPTDYESWPYSSWPYYTQGWQTDWVQQHKIFELFEGGDYREFVRSYEPIADEVKYLKAMLAS